MNVIPEKKVVFIKLDLYVFIVSYVRCALKLCN